MFPAASRSSSETVPAFAKESVATASPAPSVAANDAVLALDESVPEYVSVCVVGVGGGTAAGPTAAVCPDGIAAEPATFDAVTRTRSVEPTSDSTGVYPLDVAPMIRAHVPPAESQRSHWYEKPRGEVP